MATIITIANQKGGCGKTTTTIQLAGGMAAAGYRVLVIDTDPQATAYLWGNADSLPFAVATVTEGALQRELTKRATDNQTDVILVDCPPGMTNATFTAMRVANAAIVPIKVSGGDYKATHPFLEVLEQILPHNPALKVMAFINDRDNSRIAKQGREFAIQTFAKYPNVRVLESEVSHFALITEVSVAGTTIFDYKPARNTKAQQSYKALVKEVVECLSKTA
jgi:chromosome partitioning protein